MVKFIQGSLKLKDNQKVYFGDNDEGSFCFDGTDLQITSADGVDIKVTPGGDGVLVIDNMNFPITDGSDGQVLTTDGAGTMDWVTVSGVAPSTFRFEVKTTGADTFQLPIYDGGTYDFHVVWGDGGEDDITAYNDAAANHSYSGAGTWNVVITGTITGWRFNYAGDYTLIYDISEWGPLNLGNNGSYFYGCTNLTVTATDPLDLTEITNLAYAFSGCTSLTTIPSMNSWDVSNVIDMQYMFYMTSIFNQDISSWNVSSVTNMESLFWDAPVFNQDISSWTVSGVINMSYLFANAYAFNQDIDSWDVSGATNMTGMFWMEAESTFNQDLSSWNTSNVITMDWMFVGVSAFDQSLGSWDITSVTDMTGMFYEATLSTANYSNTLIGWEAQNEQSDVEFDGGNSKYSAGVAATARAALVANGWTITDGGQVAFRFEVKTTGGDNFQLPIYDGGTYDFHVVWGDGGENDITAYNDAAANHYYSGAGTWDVVITGTITGWRFADGGDKILIHDISEWGPLNLGNNDSYFKGCTNLTVSATDILDLTGTTTLLFAFRDCLALTVLDVSSWNVANVINFSNAFRECPVLTTMDVSSWNVSSATTFYYAFRGCASLTTLDMSSWNVASVTTFSNAFYLCTSLTPLGVNNWDITAMTDATNMFSGVTLTTVNYDAILIGFEAGPHQDNVTFHGGNSTYTDPGPAKTARDALETNGWNITDGGPA